MAKARQKRTSVIASKPYPLTGDPASAVHEGSGVTVEQELVRRLREMGQAYAEGDQIPPVAILWPDGDMRWAGVMTELKSQIPELYAFGMIDPDDRTGPAIWLRCIEARTAEPSPEKGVPPIFYLPGISRQALRAVEECPAELEPLVELQFRGAVWSHPNGRDWTPFAFLSSLHGGLGFDIPGDSETASALDRALAVVLKERIVDLAGQKLDAQFLNRLLTPDLPVEILRWMNEPAAARKRKSDSEWEAFCAQCAADYRFHPQQDGELKAAELLGNRMGEWGAVWSRFVEAPTRYAGVVTLLEQTAPATDGTLGLDREYWPTHNDQDEAALGKALLALKDKSRDEAEKAILRLEREHGVRRSWVWRELGRAPLAVALEHLSLLATVTRKPLADAAPEGMAEQYVKSGWEMDAAAMAALASGTTPETDDAIVTALRALYLPWMDESARNLQQLAARSPDALKPRLEPVEATDGRVVVFVDGLRCDLARRLLNCLTAEGAQLQFEWDWAAFPSVTSTGKAAISPMANALTGGGPEDAFAPSIEGTEKRWTADRFRAYLKAQGVQVLQGRDGGEPSGSAWAEAGSIDSRGHNEGVKTAKLLEQEVRDIAGRIHELLEAGWREVVVVTDHGWLLAPGGLPKVSLSHFIVEHQWGRCAAVKSASATDLPTLSWHWNPSVTVATPPGVGCFRAGMDYAHGGLSLQEMVIPRLTVSPGQSMGGQGKISAVKWIGLRCRVSVQHAAPGMKADVRGRPADAKSSKAEGGQPKELGLDGTVSLYVGDDGESGNAAVVVLLGPDGTPVHTVPTVIGEDT